MSLLIGELAPEFKTTAAFGKTFKNVSLQDYRGKYVLLFFYPLDFTFVCPTELHAFQEKLSEFESHNTQVLGCSIDSHFAHHAWLQIAKEHGGIQGVEYGLLSDVGGHIARSYHVLRKDGIACRGLFLIDKEGIIRHQVVNDLPLGRSTTEALRMVKALQHIEKHGEVCPANWDPTKKAIHPTHESVSSYLGSCQVRS